MLTNANTKRFRIVQIYRELSAHKKATFWFNNGDN